jgi:glycosyltransferase involved in cell wall biosynthesis
MKKNLKKILYIGNNFSKKTGYNSTLSTLSGMLLDEGFYVVISSDKRNKFLRLIDMCISVFRNRKYVDYVLIDTFSTLNFYYAFFVSQICRLFSLKYIPILHGGNLPNRLDTSSKLSKMIFNNSFINVTPSNYLAMEFLKRNFKTKYIPNAISLDKYNFKERIMCTPRILWVRAFDKIYNPILAIKVIQSLKNRFPDAHLCMVGPVKDSSFNEVKTLVDAFGLEDNVTFTGVLLMEQWHQLSKEYDIFINTTTIDNMPVSVIEAMALGLPVISTNVGGMPFLISNNENGILVSSNNEIEMAKEIIRLIENPKETNRICKNARLFTEQFDLEIVKKQWLNILNK